MTVDSGDDHHPDGDRAAGRYRVPWEDSVQVTDGTPCGLPAPTRAFGEPLLKEAAE